MGQTWDETVKRNQELEARVAELEAKLARYEAIPTLDDCIHMDRLEAINKEQGANIRRYRSALETIADPSTASITYAGTVDTLRSLARNALRG